MKRRRNIAYVLMAVCMVMLTAGILPHHHHFNFICMQSSCGGCEEACCGCSCNCGCGEECCGGTTHEHSVPGGCEEGCITQFRCSVPPSGTDVLPVFPPVTLLYSIADMLRLGMPDQPDDEWNFPYIESLHSLAVRRTEGLRAPPCA